VEIICAASPREHPLREGENAKNQIRSKQIAQI
jgi:hypothetical protein